MSASVRAAEEAAVWIALSEVGGAYAEAAAAVSAELEGTPFLTRPWQEFSREPGRPRLVVAVGNQALRGMLDNGPAAPLLAVLTPAPVFERETERLRGQAATAVLLEQPPARQLALLRLALPERPRVGLLLGAESQRKEMLYRRAAPPLTRRLVVGTAPTAQAVGAVLQEILEDSDVLLAVADPMVFNNASLHAILTAAYRRRVPLMGFSPAYVKAGALLVLYSTPAQMGRQAGGIARQFLAGRSLPQPQAPEDFTVGVNAEVARSLGIALEAADGAALASRLRKEEAR